MDAQKFNDLNGDLTTVLKDKTIKFLIKNFKGNVDPVVLLNLILSSHVSSLQVCVNLLTASHAELRDQADIFLRKLVEFLKEIDLVKSPIIEH